MGKRTKVIALFQTRWRSFPPPSAIDLSNDLANTFGKLEVERQACRLVEFFQMRGAWGFFDLDSLKAFYKDKGYPTNQMLYGLICPWFSNERLLVESIHVPGPYIVMCSDGSLLLTQHFLNRLKAYIRTDAGRMKKSA